MNNETPEVPLKIGSAPQIEDGMLTGNHVIGFVVPSTTIVPLGQLNFLLSDLIQRFIKS